MPIELKKCTLASSFDSRIFFAGNQDYPSTLFHSELEDPRYVRDTAYYEEGLDFAEIKALVPGNSAIWVFKEPSQNNTTVLKDNVIITLLSPSSLGCCPVLNVTTPVVLFTVKSIFSIKVEPLTVAVIKYTDALSSPVVSK